jgi:hypothetical protein
LLQRPTGSLQGRFCSGVLPVITQISMTCPWEDDITLIALIYAHEMSDDVRISERFDLRQSFVLLQEVLFLGELFVIFGIEFSREITFLIK